MAVTGANHERITLANKPLQKVSLVVYDFTEQSLTGLFPSLQLEVLKFIHVLMSMSVVLISITCESLLLLCIDLLFIFGRLF